VIKAITGLAKVDWSKSYGIGKGNSELRVPSFFRILARAIIYVYSISADGYYLAVKDSGMRRRYTACGAGSKARAFFVWKEGCCGEVGGICA